jgi:hypothetical protein
LTVDALRVRIKVGFQRMAIDPALGVRRILSPNRAACGCASNSMKGPYG